MQRKVKTEIRQAQIAQVCLDIISERGVGALNVTDVATRLGLATSALYRHYRNKDDMVEAVVQILSDKIRHDFYLACKQGRDVFEKLEIFLRYEVKSIKESRAIQMIFYSDDVQNNKNNQRERIRKIFSGVPEFLNAIFTEGQRNGLIRDDVDPETLEMMFVGLYIPASAAAVVKGEDYDFEKRVSEAWPLFKEVIRKT